MISFLKQVAKQHFVILACAIFVGVFWPQLRRNLAYFKGFSEKSANADNAGLNTNTIGNNMRIFNSDELAQYNGVQRPQLYLAILGNVYDVTKGDKHYGSDGSYHYFVGKDASVAFITGDFEKKSDEELDESDVLGRLKHQEIYSLKQWKEFYNKEYTFVGRLSGRLYDASGAETPYYYKVMEQVEIAIAEKKRDELLRVQYPPCNIEWKEETGTRVWCSQQSGGIDRSWTGVPRKYFEAGKPDFRCACVPEDQLSDASLREYDNCGVKEISCTYKV